MGGGWEASASVSEGAELAGLSGSVVGEVESVSICVAGECCWRVVGGAVAYLEEEREREGMWHESPRDISWSLFCGSMGEVEEG